MPINSHCHCRIPWPWPRPWPWSLARLRSHCLCTSPSTPAPDLAVCRPDRCRGVPRRPEKPDTGLPANCIASEVSDSVVQAPSARHTAKPLEPCRSSSCDNRTSQHFHGVGASTTCGSLPNLPEASVSEWCSRFGGGRSGSEGAYSLINLRAGNPKRSLDRSGTCEGRGDSGSLALGALGSGPTAHTPPRRHSLALAHTGPRSPRDSPRPQKRHKKPGKP